MSAEAKTFSWYAIRIRTRFEQTTSTALAGRGYEDYLPLHRVRKRWSDRSKDLDLPLFPGYLFCRFDVQARLPILTTPGVLSIVGLGRMPVPIPDQEIESIRMMERSGLNLHPWPQLAVGSRVLIEDGPLKGLEGVALDVRNKHHLFVSVPLLQRSISVEIDRDSVRPISAPAISKAFRGVDRFPVVAKVA
jgi:transcription antitermination factor NusG